MKRIDAIVRPEKVGDCVVALDSLGVSGVTVYEARGHGAQGGVMVADEGSPYRVSLLPKSVLVAVVHDHLCESVIDSLAAAAQTGHIGDGKIFVSTIDDAVRVRTGEVGSEAI